MAKSAATMTALILPAWMALDMVGSGSDGIADAPRSAKHRLHVLDGFRHGAAKLLHADRHAVELLLDDALGLHLERAGGLLVHVRPDLVGDREARAHHAAQHRDLDQLERRAGKAGVASRHRNAVLPEQVLLEPCPEVGIHQAQPVEYPLRHPARPQVALEVRVQRLAQVEDAGLARILLESQVGEVGLDGFETMHQSDTPGGASHLATFR